MPHQQHMIELTLRVTTADESAAARVVEILARTALGVSAEDHVQVSTDVDRFAVACHHDHDEHEVQP